MCGIAGVLNLDASAQPPELDTLARMAAALHHRGPDELGAYRDARVGLSHTRLSIIDLATGQQPLTNETGTIWIVFNGEIFNYVELRNELLAAGHQFRTRSDTEVIVHAYETWGTAAFDRFNGQWAVALWDARRQVLVLARDPFGVRPVYIARQGTQLYFSSEIKAIFAADPSIPRRFDIGGLDQLFTFWTTVAPRTVFDGIEELRPGAVRTYSPDGVRESTSVQWSYPPTGAEFHGSVDDAADAVRSALEDATRLRMTRADVPVGTYLSGGLDSSLITALALRSAGSRLRTFSVRFEDAEYDETEHQRTMAAYLGSEHCDTLVTSADIASVFPDVIRHTERPVLRTAAAPLFLLSRLVSNAGIKVVLSGEGADEMFAGYDLFREAKVRRFWARRPDSPLRAGLLRRLYPYLERSPVSQQSIARQFFGQALDRFMEPGFGHEPRWRSTSALKRLFSADLRGQLTGRDTIAELLSDVPAGFRRWDSLAQDQYLEIRTLLSGYLLSSQGDRMLMAHSVEGRFPFLDRHVARLADSLPASMKLRALDEKHVLKRASRGLMPESVRRRKKQPYRAPDAAALLHPRGADWVDEVTSEASLADAGVFSRRAVSHLIAKCRAGREAGRLSNADNMALVGVLSAQLLHHLYVRQAPESRPFAGFTTLIDGLPRSLSRSA
jgi:asparagine synthase (glutamine-hydrolysing)